MSSLGDRVLRQEIDYENKNISSRSAKVSERANDKRKDAGSDLFIDIRDS